MGRERTKRIPLGLLSKLDLEWERGQKKGDWRDHRKVTHRTYCTTLTIETLNTHLNECSFVLMNSLLQQKDSQRRQRKTQEGLTDGILSHVFVAYNKNRGVPKPIEYCVSEFYTLYRSSFLVSYLKAKLCHLTFP